MTTHKVSAFENGFDPPILTIQVGDTVEFWAQENNHSIVFNHLTVGSPSIEEGQSWSCVFLIQGTYLYKCGMDPKMTGTISVGG